MKFVKLAVQIVIAIALIALLVWLARRYDVVDKLRSIDRRFLAGALGVWLTATAINSLRWKVLLDNVGIRRSFLSLWPLYLIGLFFSQFLPTGTGGDAVRIFEVARRSGKTAGAVVAVLQERVFGLGISMLIGLGASIWYWKQLPPEFRIWIALIQLAGFCGLVVFCYPHRFVAMAIGFSGKLGKKIEKVLRPVLALPPLTPTRFFAAAIVTAVGVVVSISTYAVLAQALGVPLGLGEFLLAVPLVWVIKMVPLTPGGVGQAEGGLAGICVMLFASAEKDVLAIAFAYLGLQLCIALLGGLLVGIRVATGTWIPKKQQEAQIETPVPTSPAP